MRKSKKQYRVLSTGYREQGINFIYFCIYSVLCTLHLVLLGNMKFNELSDISQLKIEELKERIQRLNINLEDIDEKFVRGSGPGGQKKNKTSNCVRLYYPELSIEVRMQEDRRRSVNRFLALREIIDKIEMVISPSTSKKLKQIKKIKQRKRAHASRTKVKYGKAD